jgi:hypothetical protein
VDLEVLRELDHRSGLERTGEWKLSATNQCRLYLEQNGYKAAGTHCNNSSADLRILRLIHMGVRVKA